VPSASPSAAPAIGPASATPPTGFPGLPIDPALAAVSLSNPPAGAAEALDLCVSPGVEDEVAGMAQLPASEVHRFTLTNGKEPELQTDSLVWAIQLEGLIPSRFGRLIDPLCVVIDGVRVTYEPYGSEGQQVVTLPGFVEPTSALPPLEP
jgi:hypothetical protein